MNVASYAVAYRNYLKRVELKNRCCARPGRVAPGVTPGQGAPAVQAAPHPQLFDPLRLLALDTRVGISISFNLLFRKPAVFPLAFTRRG
jgi:hypothetical protein